ncbi:MAG: hypothetical protein H7257_01205 [Taibaiella sp.]|nr:hypothetical protein [Taibaiella sp.]
MDASIEIIAEVHHHPGADRLDLARILGFQCVIEKGSYKGGEKVVYIRPDSLLPEVEWAEEYRKYSPNRIKAVKLRGEWSEGVIVPLHKLPAAIAELPVGSDVAEFIGVRHFEPPVPKELNAKRPLPFGIPKTDEERWENMIDKLPMGEPVDITLKIDGQSWSIYYNIPTDEFGILGRTLGYHHDTENPYSVHLHRTYKTLEREFKDYCIAAGKSLCLRGESYGGGIQRAKNNPHGAANPGIAIFSCYLIEERRYANKGDAFYFVNVCAALQLPIVPILESHVPLTQELIDYYSTGIEQVLGKPFEGVVVKHARGTFKIINKIYDSRK